MARHALAYLPVGIVFVAIPILVLGASLSWCTQQQPVTSENGRQVFSLRTLVALVTVTAVVLGVAQYSLLVAISLMAIGIPPRRTLARLQKQRQQRAVIGATETIEACVGSTGVVILGIMTVTSLSVIVGMTVLVVRYFNR